MAKWMAKCMVIELHEGANGLLHLCSGLGQVHLYRPTFCNDWTNPPWNHSAMTICLSFRDRRCLLRLWCHPRAKVLAPVQKSDSPGIITLG